MCGVNPANTRKFFEFDAETTEATLFRLSSIRRRFIYIFYRRKNKQNAENVYFYLFRIILQRSTS